MRRVAAVVLLLAAAAAFLAWPRSRPVRAASFVGRESCRKCHEEQARAFEGSHHDLAMDVATEATVLGDFGDAAFDHHGEPVRFLRRDGRFLVATEGRELQVSHVFGVDPLQQYLVAADGGRLQALTVAWDVAEGRWYALYPERHGPGDYLHWSGLGMNWNFMCAECHSTDLRRNYDAAKGTYATAWSEIDVSCEACHGPGSEHVAWAEEGEEGEDARLPVAFRGAPAQAEVEACARCHARRAIVDGDYGHGRPLLDHYLPQLLTEDLYHADGAIRDEVYEYGSFAQSRMYARGVRCTDCHDPHTARLRVEGNLTCVRCHKPEPPPGFEGLLSKDYDTEAHHFHALGGPGSACVDCHMPATTYMGVDPRRDHRFGVPRPDFAAAPDACTGCHADRGREWVLDAFRRWYPGIAERRPSFAPVLAAARAGEPGAWEGLVRLAAAREPAIVRATALFELRDWPRAESASAASSALDDPDPLVRATAASVLAGLLPPGGGRLALLAPLLEDPVRAVRVEAARALAAVPEARQGEAFRRALVELERRHAAHLDRPDGPFNRGALREDMGDPTGAERGYRAALALDPTFVPARFNLANLLNAQGRNDEAEQQLRAVLGTDPGNGEAHYSIGLLLAETGDSEAEAHLRKALERLPGHPRVRYNLAMLLQEKGRDADAAELLREAIGLAPDDADAVHALCLLHARRGEWDEAERWARRLVGLDPRAEPVLEAVRERRPPR